MTRPARLSLCTFEEVDDYLVRSRGIIVPTGSTEQHGPIGAIGTDALCAEEIALAAARQCGALVAPTVCYTPAPFNMAFAGTVSIRKQTFVALLSDIVNSLTTHGFERIYVINGHGANIEPLRSLEAGGLPLRIRSWWDFDSVNALRSALYGEWEGMHATPSEIAIVQATHRVVDRAPPPRPDAPLSTDVIRAHAGDRHGPPAEHRASFPDGRVGSDSALATPTAGSELLACAAAAVAADYDDYNQES